MFVAGLEKHIENYRYFFREILQVNYIKKINLLQSSAILKIKSTELPEMVRTDFL